MFAISKNLNPSLDCDTKDFKIEWNKVSLIHVVTLLVLINHGTLNSEIIEHIKTVKCKAEKVDIFHSSMAIKHLWTEVLYKLIPQ